MDLVVGAGVLGVELVTGKAEKDELVRVFGGDFLVEGFEAGELGCEAAFGGGVDHEDYFALVLGERILCAFFCGRVSGEAREFGGARGTYCLWA